MDQVAQIVMRPIEELQPYDRNAKHHPPAQVEMIARSIREFGWTVPVLIDADDSVIAGHGRLEAARALEMAEVPTIRLEHLTPAQVRAYRLADNRLAEMAPWDTDALEEELRALSLEDFEMADLGFDAESLMELLPVEGDTPARGQLLADFLEPPFSVLMTTSRRWRHRKRAWMDVLPYGDYADIGRGQNLLSEGSSTYKDMQFYVKKEAVEARLGRSLTTKEFREKHYRPPGGKPGRSTARIYTGTSMFDPVLAELVVAWFSPPEGDVCDPFSGGLERGVVAAMKGRRYRGIDLLQWQCEANASAAEQLGLEPIPLWHCGDGRDALDVWGADSADLIFTCPPYWHLERYSDDPADLSNMPWEEFREAHAAVIAASAETLRDNRFAAWVVGDVRDKDGRYVRLHDATKDAFSEAGMPLHAEMILVTAVGNRGIRARRPMEAKRNITRRHEYVLIFCKGDPAAAASALGPVEVGELPDEEQAGPE